LGSYPTVYPAAHRGPCYSRSYHNRHLPFCAQLKSLVTSWRVAVRCVRLRSDTLQRTLWGVDAARIGGILMCPASSVELYEGHERRAALLEVCALTMRRGRVVVCFSVGAHVQPNTRAGGHRPSKGLRHRSAARLRAAGRQVRGPRDGEAAGAQRAAHGRGVRRSLLDRRECACVCTICTPLMLPSRLSLYSGLQWPCNTVCSLRKAHLESHTHCGTTCTLVQPEGWILGCSMTSPWCDWLHGRWAPDR
jgi:hypothetical protein